MPRKKKTPSKKEEAKPEMKRSSTMTITSTEGEAFLNDKGHVAHNEDEMETRTKKRTRETVDDLLGADAKKEVQMSDEDLEKYKSNLRMVFRLFDSNRDGLIGKTEIESVFRSLGKKPTADKVKKIISSASKKNKDGVTIDEFVDYMVNKKKLKSKEEEKESPTKKKKATKAKPTTPTKETPTKESSTKTTPPKPTPAKKASPAKKKETQKEKEDKKEDEKKDDAVETSRPTLQRGLSITDFFTPFAGLHDEINTAERDDHNNPKGRAFDLGHERAFNIFSIILFNPRQSLKKGVTDPKTLWDESVKALQSKGFTVFSASSEKEFLDQLHNYDEAWFSSSEKDPENPKEFVSQLRKFHEDGKGLCIWSDNSPFFIHANLVLKDLLGIQVIGNTPGSQILKVGDGNKSGQFARHLLTTGIVNLHEGVTICYPDKVTDKMHVIGTSSNNHPCMFYCEPSEKAGPIVVDCGYTKLYSHNWSKTAGTERYVRNVAVWLLGLDYRMKIGAPWKGPISTSKPEDDENKNSMEKS